MVVSKSDGGVFLSYKHLIYEDNAWKMKQNRYQMQRTRTSRTSHYFMSYLEDSQEAYVQQKQYAALHESLF